MKEIIAFLCGEGELYGCSFSEKPEGEKENFWWRKHLRHARDVQAHNLEKLQRENEGLRAEREEIAAHLVCVCIDTKTPLPIGNPVAEIQAEAVEKAALEVIEKNDHVTERLILGSNKQPDNYRAEGWYQAQRALEVYAASLRKGSSESDGGGCEE